jgi:hypothetical protein
MQSHKQTSGPCANQRFPILTTEWEGALANESSSTIGAFCTTAGLSKIATKTLLGSTLPMLYMKIDPSGVVSNIIMNRETQYQFPQLIIINHNSFHLNKEA